MTAREQANDYESMTDELDMYDNSMADLKEYVEEKEMSE